MTFQNSGAFVLMAALALGGCVTPVTPSDPFAGLRPGLWERESDGGCESDLPPDIALSTCHGFVRLNCLRNDARRGASSPLGPYLRTPEGWSVERVVDNGSKGVSTISISITGDLTTDYVVEWVRITKGAADPVLNRFDKYAERSFWVSRDCPELVRGSMVGTLDRFWFDHPDDFREQ